MDFKKTIEVTDELIQNAHSQMLASIEISQASKEMGQDEAHMNHVFSLVKDEAKQALNLIKGMELNADARILEVGAGYGLASICLALAGFSVTALEPGGTGFEDYVGTSSTFAQMCNVRVTHLETGAEEAAFSEIPQFDLIISNNVLEHIRHIDDALVNLKSALKNDGIMVHSCPNYAFPYEPHFGIPLVPIFPKLTKYLLPKSIAASGLWASLNFITAHHIKSFYKKQGLYVVFRQGTMFSSISRFRNDELFAARHPFLQKVFSNNLVFQTSRRLLNIPVQLATPMDFLVCFPGHKDDQRVLDWLNKSIDN
jgi:2-polyprenyl-3-methyl-5-hydroxy-6-metoxy-1,4-benzoquinol methylase